MKIVQQRDLANHYMIISDREEEKEETYQTRMLQENEIEGFLSCHVERVDDERLYCYNITSRQPLSEIASDGQIGSELLRGLLSALLFALKNLNEYLLPPDGILLDPDCIFANSLREDFRFCYYPENPASFSGSLKKFSEFLLPRLNHDDERAVMLGYSFYSECVNDTLSEDSFFRLLYAEQTGNAKITLRTKMTGQTGEPTAGSGVSGETERTESKERERAQILDDFFAEDGEEEEDPLKKNEIHTLILAAVFAAAAFLLSVVFEKTDVGIGTAVLLMAGAIFLNRLRRKRLSEGKNRLFGLPVKGAESGTLSFGNDGSFGKEGGLHRLFRKEPKDAEQDRADSDSGTEEFDLSTFSDDIFGPEDGDEWERPAYGQMAPPFRSSVSERDSKEKGDTGRDSEAGTALMTGSEETVLLSEVNRNPGKIRAWLISMDGDEPDHILTEDAYRIGKSDQVCDIVLPSQAVSRLHAKLIWSGDTYLLRDMRSRNATYINGTMLDAARDIPLKNGDCCRFADRTYRYRFEYGGRAKNGGGPLAEH
ncbi:MAG: DUF6382 domain-containing protein [Bilifractor sp.]|jgi:hypothetical protein